MKQGRKDSRSLFIRKGATILAIMLTCSVAFSSCAPAENMSLQSNETFESVNDRGVGGTSSTNTQVEQGGNTQKGNQHSSKLEGATETVDENNIVHGTTQQGISYTIRGRGEQTADTSKVTLCAVGDQIASSDAMPIADRYAGETGDGRYDFTPFYQEIAPFIQQQDLRFIDQETVMAGTDQYEYAGYPSFNSPDACAEAISEVGFNMVNFATNHVYDKGLYGVERSHEVWNQYPALLVAGSFASQEERDTVHMIERNGITFAFLAYTYGDNNYSDAAGMPNTYSLCVFDEMTVEAEVKRAQEVADVVIVAMHWGTEYVNEPSEWQYEKAAFLADLDVDLVLGSHAHIMQPVKYITGENGNTIPVVFGLSDIVSGWTITDTILSGIFTCEFVSDGPGSEIKIENLTWYPTIEWSDGSEVYVRMLKDMDEASINQNTRTPDVSDDFNYITNKVNSIGMEIPIVM